MLLIGAQHLHDSAATVSEATNPAALLKPIQVNGDLALRAADRLREPTHRGCDECADGVCAEVTTKKLDGRDTEIAKRVIHDVPPIVRARAARGPGRCRRRFQAPGDRG